MEVHHHPHVEKKNFKEYFLEFLMIFLAVYQELFETSVQTVTQYYEKCTFGRRLKSILFFGEISIFYTDFSKDIFQCQLIKLEKCNIFI